MLVIRGMRCFNTAYEILDSAVFDPFIDCSELHLRVAKLSKPLPCKIRRHLLQRGWAKPALWCTIERLVSAGGQMLVVPDLDINHLPGSIRRVHFCIYGLAPWLNIWRRRMEGETGNKTIGEAATVRLQPGLFRNQECGIANRYPCITILALHRVRRQVSPASPTRLAKHRNATNNCAVRLGMLTSHYLSFGIGRAKPDCFAKLDAIAFRPLVGRNCRSRTPSCCRCYVSY
jgi:hypothetical protein